MKVNKHHIFFVVILGLFLLPSVSLAVSEYDHCVVDSYNYVDCYKEMDDCMDDAVYPNTCHPRTTFIQDGYVPFDENNNPYEVKQIIDKNPPAEPHEDEAHCFWANGIEYEGITYDDVYACYSDEASCVKAVRNITPDRYEFGGRCEYAGGIDAGDATTTGPSFENYGSGGPTSPVIPVMDYEEGIPTNGDSTYNTAYPDALVQCTSSCDFHDFVALLQRLTTFFLVAIAAPFAAIFFVYAGFLYMTAAGNQAKMNQAKSIFIWVVIGFAIALAAWLLVNTLITGLNVESKFNFLD